MRVEIDLKFCRYCHYFVFSSDDEMEFLDECRCSADGLVVSDYDSCDFFRINRETVTELKRDYRSVSIVKEK